VLYGAVLVDMMGFGIVLPLLPFYATNLGASPLQVTLIGASFSAMQLAAAPLWGRLSDRRGRRPLLIAGLFASSASYLLFGLAHSLGLLLISRIVAGAAGGTISVAQAYAADSTSSEDRARGMGHIGAASGLGVMLGPAIGGLFSRWGLGVPGYVAAGLCLLNGIAAIYFLPETRTHAARAQDHHWQAATLRSWLLSMTRYPLSLFLSVYFLTISSFTAMTAVLALYLYKRFGIVEQQMAVVFTLAGGATVVVRGFMLGPLVRRVGENITVRIGIVALAFAMIALPVLPTTWTAYLIVPIWAFGAGTLFPALATLVSRATDADSQGSILGGSQVVGGLGRVVGPMWAGWLFQSVGIASPFKVGAVLVALAGFFRCECPDACPAKQ
jgi:MFS family permease